MALVNQLVTVIQSHGPWALLVILGIAYWRKDQAYSAAAEAAIKAEAAHAKEVRDIMREQRLDDRETTEALVLFQATITSMHDTLKILAVKVAPRGSDVQEERS